MIRYTAFSIFIKDSYWEGWVNYDYELHPRQEYLVVFLHDHKAYLDRIRVTYYIIRRAYLTRRTYLLKAYYPIFEVATGQYKIL